MNNEDKILEVLGGLTKTVDGLTKNVDVIQKELKEFRKETNERFDVLEDGFDLLNTMNADNHLVIKKDIRDLKDNVDDLNIDINNISIKTLQNDSQLIRLVRDQK